MNPSSFREYDIRGVADRDLTDDVAEAIGRAYASRLLEGRTAREPLRVCVGRDCRLSGPRLYAALVRGLTRHGVHVIDVGVGPTPYLYFSVHHTNADGGIMITGSHNPGDENGFKMMIGKGSFFGPEIIALRERIERGGYAEEKPGAVESLDLRQPYLEVLTKDVRLSGKGVACVLDAGNGAGGPLGVAALERAGVKVDPLFCDMDGTFPNHHPDPTVPKNLVALIERVKATGARVGLAYDGDADRLGAVDDEGNIIWGDKLLVLFARALLKVHPGAAVIGEVKCSQTLYDDIAAHGGQPILWKTGHSLIKAKMKESGALLAGEMSGHLFFADRWFGFDDALYAGLRLLEILADDPRTLREMLADVPATFTTPEIRVDCPDALKFSVVEKVTAHFQAKGNAVVTIDGARIAFPSKTPGAPSWGLVRASNTGPILVLRFEAGSEEELVANRAEVEAVVAAARA